MLGELIQSTKSKVVAIVSSIGYVGVNVAVHHLINASGKAGSLVDTQFLGGRSSSVLVQKIGRGLRTAKDKGTLQYHDFLFEGNDYLNKHSRLRINILLEEGHECYVDSTDSWQRITAPMPTSIRSATSFLGSPLEE